MSTFFAASSPRSSGFLIARKANYAVPTISRRRFNNCGTYDKRRYRCLPAMRAPDVITPYECVFGNAD